MRLLIFHGNLAYKATEAVKISIRDEATEGEWKDFENCLTVFCAIEASDEGRLSEIVKKAAEEIKLVADRVKVMNIVLYPHAHIFPRKLAKPKFAIRLLQSLTIALQDQGFSVHQTPFGWYKAFRLECFGHPLAESGRSID
ncbi:MAG: threonyl-tRNA synthetase editing domain-containing protein [Promethearchaeota archaeon]